MLLPEGMGVGNSFRSLTGGVFFITFLGKKPPQSRHIRSCTFVGPFINFLISQNKADLHPVFQCDLYKRHFLSVGLTDVTLHR